MCIIECNTKKKFDKCKIQVTLTIRTGVTGRIYVGQIGFLYRKNTEKYNKVTLHTYSGHTKRNITGSTANSRCIEALGRVSGDRNTDDFRVTRYMPL